MISHGSVGRGYRSVKRRAQEFVKKWKSGGQQRLGSQDGRELSNRIFGPYPPEPLLTTTSTPSHAETGTSAPLHEPPILPISEHQETPPIRELTSLFVIRLNHLSVTSSEPSQSIGLDLSLEPPFASASNFDDPLPFAPTRSKIPDDVTSTPTHRDGDETGAKYSAGGPNHSTRPH